MEDFKEYIVTAKTHECLECLYQDLETLGGSETIPEREVECCNRRSFSRNTHYLLTSEESEKLILDDRVLAVTDIDLLRSVKVEPHYERSSSLWNKGASQVVTHDNWSILRCERGEQIYGWGNDGIPNQTGIITTTSSGKNVDVVIVDGLIDPDNPEFAKNADGTGGTRVIQYNWLGYVGGNYDYSKLNYSDGINSTEAGQNDHGSSVASTAAGNTLGWAVDANIYNIYPYGSIGSNADLSWSTIIDHIRHFHNNKVVNPITGVKNPTIVNNSWGSFITLNKSNIEWINWRGTRYNGPFTDEQLQSYGISLESITSTTVRVLFYSVIQEVDMEDAVNDGIIFVGSAGNEGYKIDKEQGIDGNNSIRGQSFYSGSSYTLSYHKGSVNTTAHSYNNGTEYSICVGATNASVVEAKRAFSNCGPRVNVYAPGTNIQVSKQIVGANIDPRSPGVAYFKEKVNGTSSSSPIVTGLIACLLEQYPRLKQADVKNYIETYWKYNQLLDSGGGYTDENSLQGGLNIHAFYKKERKLSGLTQPKVEYWKRATSGNVWPRRNMVTFGR